MSRQASDLPLRVHALDGLRGGLAFIVVLWHATSPLGFVWLGHATKFAVFGFFVISGFVLTRAWDRRPLAFLLQRIVRLWPTYAVCLLAGYAIARAPVDWRLFLWFPLIAPDAEPRIDPPIWSLIVEAWAMPLMPLIVWFGSGALQRAWLGFVAACVAALVAEDPAWRQLWLGLAYFVLGAWLSRYTPHSLWLEAAPAQWLGKISYSLYLSHWPLFALAREAFGPAGALAALPLSLPVAFVVYVAVERPSIAASRRLKGWLAGGRPTLAIMSGSAG